MTLPAEPRNDAYARHFPTGRKDMTDDTERDALADILMSDAVMRTSAMGRDYALVEADAILAAGFRRQEPSTTQTITHLEADLNASRAREELATQKIGELEAQIAGDTHRVIIGEAVLRGDYDTFAAQIRKHPLYPAAERALNAIDSLARAARIESGESPA